MSQAYYRKFRPSSWDEVVAQDHVIQTLRNAVQQEKVVHAYIFAGPRGTGKTTTARIIAKAVNCLAEDPQSRPDNSCAHCQDINAGRFLDLIEIDAASNTSVEDVRDLREKINYSPSKGRYKVYIIDEVHMLSNAAFNALLKTLEEPPPHAIFILATTEVHKIPATVLSRCQRHEFRRIPINFITAQLKAIVEQEGLKADPSVLTLIARHATGSMRDAISLLDQLASTGDALDLPLAQSVLGSATQESVFELMDAITEGKTGESMNIIQQALNSGSDTRQYARQIVDFLRNILMVKISNEDSIEVTKDMKDRLQIHAKSMSMPYLLSAIRLFNRAANSTQNNWQPSLQLEVATSEVIGLRKKQNTFESDAEKKEETSKNSQAAQIQEVAQEISPQKNKVNKTKKQINNKIEKGNPPKTGVQKPSEAKPEKKVQEANSGQQQTLHHLKTIKDHWVDIRSRVKEELPQTEALLNSCKTITMERGMLVLGFASDILKEKMENGNHLALTTKAIQSVVHFDVSVVCKVVHPNSGPVPADLDIAGDGMVGTALSLGGKIIEAE